MAQARPKLTEELKSLSNTNWERIIDNYIKSQRDRDIARMYYLDGYPQIEIAYELGCSRSTIKRRLPKLINIIEKHKNEP